MTEAELGVKSVPRNPLLFGMLHRMDAVEQWVVGDVHANDLPGHTQARIVLRTPTMPGTGGLDEPG